MVHADNDAERTVLEFFRILSTGDIEAIRATLHDDVTWTPQVKDIPGAGTYRGKKGVCDEFLAPVRGMFAPGDPKTTVKSYTGQCVVAFLVAATEAGLPLMQFVHAPYYALFLVGPAANLVEIAMDRRRRTAPASVPASVS